MNHTIRQRYIVGTIKAGVPNPSRAMAEYIQARERNAVMPNPALVKACWDALSKDEQDRVDALLLGAMRK